MRSFHLQSGEEITAALPEAEVVALLASGEVTPDQPCRLAEEDVWRTVADFFPSGSGLKVRTAKPPASAAEQISAANRIDDPTRRRLLAYGLADAVNIDGFTQSQAVTAIVRKEEETRGIWRAHRRVQVGAFLGLLVLGYFTEVDAQRHLRPTRRTGLGQHQGHLAVVDAEGRRCIGARLHLRGRKTQGFTKTARVGFERRGGHVCAPCWRIKVECLRATQEKCHARGWRGSVSAH
jgi:hypothetical protein